MKTLLLLSLILSGTAIAQTNVIAAKSHASYEITDKNDCDNFGDPVEQRTIESVTYLKDNCIAEVYNSMWVKGQKEYDTICNHPFLTPGQIDLERIKAMYPDKTTFIGFEQFEQSQETDERKLKKERRKQKKSSSSLIFLFTGITLFLIYLFTPRKILSQS